jgi:streptogramin lyase
VRPTPRILGFVAMLATAVSLAPAAGAQSLFWVDTNFGAPTLNRSNPDGAATLSIPLPEGTLPEGLALDANGRVYWGEAAWTNARLRTASPSLAGDATLVPGGSVLRGVAVNPVAQHVYWTTSNLAGGPSIRRVSLNGTGATTLISLPITANPRGIAVDHAGGRIYWADFNNGAIMRANLDGSGIATFMSLPAGAAPYGLAVDSPGQRVFWTEYGGGRVMRVNTNATGLTELYNSRPQPTYIAHDPVTNRIYWAEAGGGIKRGAVAGGGMVTSLAAPIQTYGGLAFSNAPTVDVPDLGPATPTEFALARPWPNPATGPIQLRFALPRESQVRLSVFDLQGREVAVLEDGVRPAGNHEAQWNAARPTAGIYFVRLATAGRSWTQRFVVTR